MSRKIGMSVGAERIEVGSPGDHVVHFYEAPDELAATVGRYLADGLQAGAAAVVIATADRCRAFEFELESAGVDVHGALRGGMLTWLDASEVLPRLNVDGRIDSEAFRREITLALVAAGQIGRPVRVYGELVDLLWRAGEVAAAMQLERLWSELIDRLQFSLLCAYHSSAASAAEHEEAFRGVCELHSAISPTSFARSRELDGESGVRREVSCQFPAGQHAARAARHFLEDALRGWGQLSVLDDARLVLSELVTNAVIHARSPVSVSVGSENATLRLAVHDHSPVRPELRPPDPERVSGRGLQLVSALSRDWGVEETPRGKVVWAELVTETAVSSL